MFGALAFAPTLTSCEEKNRNEKLTAKVLPKEEDFKQQTPKIVKTNEGKIINVIGDKQTFKLTGKDTNGQFLLIEELNEPGTVIPLHVHENEDEIFKILEGEMELTIGNETMTLTEGDLAFAPRGIPHSWKIVGDKTAKVILSVFPAGLEYMFEELGELPPGPPNFETITKICGKYDVRFL